MDTVELPPEIWSTIILLAKPSYRQLMQLSTVSRKFRRLILTKWFLKMCFARYPVLQRDLILHIDFTNVTDTLGNPLVNSIRGVRGFDHRLLADNHGLGIENNEIFGRVLTFNAFEPTEVFNAFTFGAVLSDAFSILLWFRCASEGKITLHFSYMYFWWCIQMDFDAEQQMKIRVHCGGRIWTIDAGKRDGHIWHHLAITRVKTALNFYIDGQMIKKIQLYEPFRSTFSTLRIASCFSHGSALADIAVWRRKLLPEIKSLYQQRTSIKQADLIEGLLNGL